MLKKINSTGNTHFDYESCSFLEMLMGEMCISEIKKLNKKIFFRTAWQQV